MRQTDQMNRAILRMKERRPRIPLWAKFEKMEISTPQAELWKYADEAKKDTLCGAAKRLLFRLSLKISGNAEKKPHEK